MRNSSDEPDSVFVVSARGNTGSRNRYHTDEDCIRLEDARTVREKDAATIPDDAEICSFCSGDIDYGATGDTKAMRRKLLAMDPDEAGLS